MRNRTRALAAPAALAFGIVAAATAAAPAMAATTDEKSYWAELGALNGSGASGQFSITLAGSEATITGEVSGLAETFDGNPYPHVQHIHIGAQGMCPTPDADKNGDGVIDTPEGAPAYGDIGTTLSLEGDTSPAAATDITMAPSGSSYTYERTFELDEATMSALEAGTGVVVVHGLDPATLSQEAQDAMSSLVPELPLAATAPAACGVLEAAQVGEMPEGGAQTGEGTAGPDAGLLALGGGLVLAAAGAVVARRRIAGQSQV